MSIRGLMVALLCGLVGLGGGALAAYVLEPRAAIGGTTRPLAASSPSLPIDPPVTVSHAPDIDYPTLSPDLALPPPVHRMSNDLATWKYHVPLGWAAYAVCTVAPCKIPTDELVPAKRIDRQSQLRFRPAGEPVIGGYSLRVKIMTNTDLNPAQMVATKIVGFRQEFTHQQFAILRRTSSAVYFTYTDGGNHLRYNFFQWFAAPGQSNATLEMSVSGRERDHEGLTALFNRFADNLSSAQ